MNRQSIEDEARRLQYEIWHKRELIFQWGEPSPIAMCKPEVAARVLELEINYQDDLGTFGTGSDIYTVAGTLDRRSRVISLSTRFGEQAMRFTGAHEVGHYLLHKGETFHRDRPLSPNGEGHGRDAREREADYFAACFLASRRLIQKAFAARFGPQPLVLDDNIAYYLKGQKADELMRAPTGSLDFAAAVAGARSFAGKPFPSLAEKFGLSIGAMAIRLHELGLAVS